ncbi:acetylglutamate kinase [Actinobacteria bacterium IMCC25003]|nr:acetylglutamate kinase [Actinobacteria bacterium IMCC25003]
MIVIKFGGHAMTDEHGGFAKAIAEAISSGVTPVVVHGGGPQIGEALKAAGIESSFVGGFRVTTPETFTVVERVLADEVGPSVAKSLKEHGVNAVAISGRTSGTLVAEPLTTLVDGTPADLGLVGVVTSVDTRALNELVSAGKVPVISPIAANEYGSVGFNVNADLAAAAIAGALDAQWLIIMTDVEGIYKNWPDKSSLISSICAEELESLKATFAEGMAPKVQACLDAIEAGAKAVRIIDGTNPSALKDALLGVGGTLVVA